MLWSEKYDPGAMALQASPSVVLSPCLKVWRASQNVQCLLPSEAEVSGCRWPSKQNLLFKDANC